MYITRKIDEDFFSYATQPSYNLDYRIFTLWNFIKIFYNGNIQITSAGRETWYNENIGGANRSYHLILNKVQAEQLGIDLRPVMAMDLQPRKMSKFIKFLKKNKWFLDMVGIRGYGFYDNFVHLDTREHKIVFRGSDELKNIFG